VRSLEVTVDTSLFTIADLRALVKTASAWSDYNADVLKQCPRNIVVDGYSSEEEFDRLGGPREDDAIDLSEPGTAMMLLVLLAFALGIDPGPGGRAVAWRPLRADTAIGRRRCGWWLSGDDEAVYYVREADHTGDADEVVSDAIAAEEDDLRALVGACRLAIDAAGGER